MDVPFPLRVLLCNWARKAGLPRAIALRVLVLRRAIELDSEVIGKLPVGSEAYILERKVVRKVTRVLVAASTAAPLGWVTATSEAGEAYLRTVQTAELKPGWSPRQDHQATLKAAIPAGSTSGVIARRHTGTSSPSASLARKKAHTDRRSLRLPLPLGRSTPPGGAGAAAEEIKL